MIFHLFQYYLDHLDHMIWIICREMVINVVVLHDILPDNSKY